MKILKIKHAKIIQGFDSHDLMAAKLFYSLFRVEKGQGHRKLLVVDEGLRSVSALSDIALPMDAISGMDNVRLNVSSPRVLLIVFETFQTLLQAPA